MKTVYDALDMALDKIEKRHLMECVDCGDELTDENRDNTHQDMCKDCVWELRVEETYHEPECDE